MKCDREGCRCTDATFEQEGKKYCGEGCAESAMSGGAGQSTACRCGHPDCAAV